jgi:hypothetical protein
MTKRKININVLDCLGGVFHMDLIGYQHINTEAQRIIEAENPKRSFENQQATKNYLVHALTDICDAGNDLILMGTNGEVQTGQLMKPDKLKLHSSFSKSVGMISTLDKWLYIRELEKQGFVVTLYSDQIFSQVYNSLRLISGSWVKVVSIPRSVVSPEIPNKFKITTKSLFKYWAHI